MARISIGSLDKAQIAELPPGLAGAAPARAYFNRTVDPLHLLLHDLSANDCLTVGPMAADCAVYVWHGAVTAGGHDLPAGSSLIIEHGKSITIRASEDAQLLTFAAANPARQPGAGGHIHLLPAGRVPRLASMGGPGAVGGGIHADSDCATCEVWLHENHFPGGVQLSPEDAAKGVHSHSEDEIIFVTGGAIRLGSKLCGPGTALAIAADTLYGFTPGPEGLSFINFRAGRPGDIRFASGISISETGYWRERLPRPDYLEPVAA